ncbi:MAG TPA: hypothetical protein VNT24_13850 [Propionibacteriaceae bacterium]|nr:hypothetical protein [Propionibacteriaceae bacterium]
MTQALLNSLTEKERQLIAETEPDALTDLDEDALLEVHARIRRARTKYVKVYRRQASAGVVAHGGRGFSYPKNQRDRDKAEVFELALARVSKRVDVVARQAAAELRAERLAAARASRGRGPASRPGPATDAVPDDTSRRRPVKTTGGLKKDASTRAQGARRQAKRDSR